MTGRSAAADRGMSESVSWALIMPVLMLCLLGLIQLAVWLHGQNTARSAAATAADLAAVSGPGGGAGGQAQQGAMAVATAGGLEGIQVSVDRGADSVAVRVEATVPLFFDLGQGRVQATSRAPVERVTRP